MRRREFISLIGGAAALPVVASAQQSAVPVVGFVRSTSLADSTHFLTAFRQGLQEAGFIQGQNVAIELRFAEGRSDRLPELVADLIHKSVAVIVANNPAAVVAKAATTNSANRVHHRGRSGRGRTCRQPQSARRQYHGCELYRQRIRDEAIGIAAPASAKGQDNGCPREPEYC